MKSPLTPFLLFAVVMFLSGCGEVDPSQAEAAVLEALKQKQAELMERMRITMANSFFLTSLGVLASTFFGHALLDALRGFGVRCFHLSPDTQRQLAQLGYGLILAIAALITLFHPVLAGIRLSILLLLAGTLVPFTKDYLPGIQSGDRQRRKLGASQMKTLFLFGALYFFVMKLLSEGGIGGLTVTALN